MATRPLFIPDLESAKFVREVPIHFKWSAGLALVQKKKNITALHEAAACLGYSPVLEISTKSERKLGRHMSAFHLKVELNDGSMVPLESAFQGSKIFEFGGPYADIYRLDSRSAKRDDRVRNSGRIVGFRLGDLDLPSEPKTSFYDWLYIRALAPHEEYLRRLEEFAGFSDIEFNPERSINCQARSCALFVSLSRKGILQQVANNPDKFWEATSLSPVGHAYTDELAQSRLL